MTETKTNSYAYVTDSERSYPAPQVKPWVEALEQKCKAGCSVPAVPTRQSNRRDSRAAWWAEFRMVRQPDGSYKNRAGEPGSRANRREWSR